MRIRQAGLALVLAVLLGAVAVSGCASEAAEEPVAPPAAEESADPGTESGGAAERPPASDAEQLTRSKCSSCHPYAQVENAKKDRAGWESTVDRMIQQNGAVISSSERDTIIRYLTARDE
jgi:cytochrome c5